MLYEELTKLRNRPLITYVTSIRPNHGGSMAQDMLPSFLEHVDAVIKNSNMGANNRSVDVIIISNGGDPVVAWRIISLLREKFSKITIIVPYAAFSAATLLALGGDEIIMHPYSHLGPLDPQLTITNPDGSRKSISYEDITKYFEFIKDIGVTDQEFIERSLNRLSSEIPPTAIGYAKRSSQLGLTMGIKLLSTHMTDENKAKLISETLNTKFYYHGYPLSRSEAKEINLPIAPSDEEVESIIWNIYKSFNDEMKFDEAYNPNKELFNDIKNQTPLQKNKMYTVKKTIKIASIESLHLESHVEVESLLIYNIADDGSIQQSIQEQASDWITKNVRNRS